MKIAGGIVCVCSAMSWAVQVHPKGAVDAKDPVVGNETFDVTWELDDGRTVIGSVVGAPERAIAELSICDEDGCAALPSIEIMYQDIVDPLTGTPLRLLQGPRLARKIVLTSDPDSLTGASDGGYREAVDYKFGPQGGDEFTSKTRGIVLLDCDGGVVCVSATCEVWLVPSDCDCDPDCCCDCWVPLGEFPCLVCVCV